LALTVINGYGVSLNPVTLSEIEVSLSPPETGKAETEPQKDNQAKIQD
jgi:hypothetical protein